MHYCWLKDGLRRRERRLRFQIHASVWLRPDIALHFAVCRYSEPMRHAVPGVNPIWRKAMPVS